MDITEKIKELVDQDIKSITIFAYAVNSMNTSLMIHAKEISDTSQAPALVLTNDYEPPKDHDTDPNDPLNIGFKKPTRGNLSTFTTSKVTDGDVSTYW